MANHFLCSVCEALSLPNLSLTLWGVLRENFSSQICPMFFSFIHLLASVYIHRCGSVQYPHRDPMESYMFSSISNFDSRIFALNY